MNGSTRSILVGYSIRSRDGRRLAVVERTGTGTWQTFGYRVEPGTLNDIAVVFQRAHASSEQAVKGAHRWADGYPPRAHRRRRKDAR